MADEGLPRLGWETDARPGETLWDTGARHLLGDAGSFGRILVAGRDDACQGAVLAYPMSTAPDPEKETRADFVPLCRGKQQIAGGWYVDFIACLPEARGAGLGRTLLRAVERLAGEAGAAWIGLLVLDDNHVARALYERQGFDPVGREKLARDRWNVSATHVIPMRKVLPSSVEMHDSSIEL